jgi:hypothetical protein
VALDLSAPNQNMPERLEHVRILLSRGPVTLTWDSRAELLDQMNHLESCRPIRDAFEAVGSSRPVELTRDEKVSLFELIEFWSTQVRDGLSGLPDGIEGLRHALQDDLHDIPPRID